MWQERCWCCSPCIPASLLDRWMDGGQAAAHYCLLSQSDWMLVPSWDLDVCDILCIKLQMKLCLSVQHQGVSWEHRQGSERGPQEKKKGGLVWDVMSFSPVTRLYAFIQSLFCHTLTRTHQIFPFLLRRSTLVSLYLNSSHTFQLYFSSVNYCLPCSREVVEVHVSGLRGVFGL